MGSNHVSSWAVTDGIISKLEAQYNLKIGHGWLQMTTTINRGYSGGPVVNARGKVVGIIVAGYIYLNETYLAAPGSSAVKVIDDLLSGKSNKEKGFEKIQIVF
jgi:S1-C subfamily serine protease